MGGGADGAGGVAACRLAGSSTGGLLDVSTAVVRGVARVP